MPKVQENKFKFDSESMEMLWDLETCQSNNRLSPNNQRCLEKPLMVNIPASEFLIRTELSLIEQVKKKNWLFINWHDLNKGRPNNYEAVETLKNHHKILPIVSIAKEECTKMNVEQLASTLATSAVATAFAVIDRPGHP